MMSFSSSWFARFLRWLARAVITRPKYFVIPQIILFVLALFYTVHHLTFDMNRDHLMAADSPLEITYQKFRKEFPGEDEMVVVIQSENRERNRQFVERLAAELQSRTNLFHEIFYKGTLTTLGPKALLLVPEKQLRAMEETLRDYRPLLEQFTQATNLNSLVEMINRQFRSAPQVKTASTESLLDLISFLKRVIVQAEQSLTQPGSPPSPGVEAIFGGGEQAEEQIYLTFNKGRIYILTARAQNESVTPEAIEVLREAMREVTFQVPGVNAGLTGGPVLDYDEMKQAQADTLVATIVALLLCSLIFILGYREVNRPVKAALCLIIGLGFSIGFTTLSVGHLNILSVAFAPMLIGLAIDFGVHFVTRYEEEIRNGRSRTEATFTATTFTGQGIATGALTTAAAFLAMALTNFKGIQEMGIISGGGLLLCLVPMMTLLPIMLIHERTQTAEPLGPKPERWGKVEQLWLRRPVWVIVITMLFCAAAAIQARKVRFDYNLMNMQSRGLPAVVYEEKLIRSADRSVLFAHVMADSAAQAREFERRLETLPAVSGVESVGGFFAEDRERKLELVRGIKQAVAGLKFADTDLTKADLVELGNNLWALTGYLGLAAEFVREKEPNVAEQMRSLRHAVIQFRRALVSGEPQIPEQLLKFEQALFEDMRRTLEAIQNQDTSTPLRPEDLPPVLRNRFVGTTGKFLVQVFPKKNLWEHGNQREFMQQVFSVVSPDRVTGPPLRLYEYTTAVKNSYQQAAYYALAAIAVMVFLHFQSLLCVLLALLPVGIGTVWLLGVMGRAGIPFNPANIMTLPLVVGIGVTNGIQVLNRFAEEKTPAILSKSTGKAVIVSGMTSIAGFGSLMLGQHQGIRSLGIVMSVGIAGCMIAGITVLPAVLTLLSRCGWKFKTK